MPKQTMYKLERLVKGEWCYWGTYGLNSIKALCNAVVDFVVIDGLDFNKEIRITKIDGDNDA